MKALTLETFNQTLLEEKQTGLVLFVKEGWKKLNRDMPISPLDFIL